MRLIVARHPKTNDVLVCEDCIRGMKRLPFSDMTAQEKQRELPFEANGEA